jgi:molybdopterin synthase sulfur carrier subunit
VRTSKCESATEVPSRSLGADVAQLRLFGPAREAAGRASDDVDGATVAAVLAAATARYGDYFAAVVAVSSIWVNGEAAEQNSPVGPQDEVTVLPPVSGGC